MNYMYREKINSLSLDEEMHCNGWNKPADHAIHC
jgi:hypothetical protein